MKYIIEQALLIGAIVFFACQPQQQKDQNAAQAPQQEINKPKPLGSEDDNAAEIARGVIDAMGGENAYANTHYLSWNFFGLRDLYWDKKEGLVRIEIPKDTTILIFDINSESGKASKSFIPVTNSDSLAKLMDLAKKIWINDSYWLVMPFKLQDPGVFLKYRGDSTMGGKAVEVLEMTFDNVGITPENKYVVYVDKSSNLICQWDYYRSTEMDTPNFSMPWKNYERHGEILLSGDRGERKLSEIRVYDKPNNLMFHSLEELLL